MDWLNRLFRWDRAKRRLYPLHAAVLSSDIYQARTLIKSGADVNERDDAGQTPLIWAVFRGDPAMAKLLLEKGADVNLCSTLGDSPLWHAEDDFGLMEIAELLKQHGAHK